MSTAFLPPHLLERLGSLELVARTVARGFVAGIHGSPYRGVGEDFARHRAYQQGDDLRYLDWKLYARTDRLHVREFREESNLRALLVVDGSASMAFAGADGVSKSRYAAFLSAALAHLMLRTGDAVGLLASGEGGELVPVRNRRGQLHDLLLHLQRMRPAGEAPLEPVLERAGGLLPRGGRVVVVSDLLDADGGEALLSVLGRLRARGDEVVVFRVATPEELGTRPLAPGLFHDPERPGREVPASPASDAGYRARVEAHYARLAARLGEQGAEYVPATTDRPVEETLIDWARTRRG